MHVPPPGGSSPLNGSHGTQGVDLMSFATWMAQNGITDLTERDLQELKEKGTIRGIRVTDPVVLQTGLALGADDGALFKKIDATTVHPNSNVGRGDGVIAAWDILTALGHGHVRADGGDTGARGAIYGLMRILGLTNLTTSDLLEIKNTGQFHGYQVTPAQREAARLLLENNGALFNELDADNNYLVRITEVEPLPVTV